MIAYLDSSVVLRLLLGQPDRLSEWRTLKSAVASALVEVECLRTLDRLRLRTEMAASQIASHREALFGLIDEMEIVEPTRPVLARAAQPLPVPLGTLDALHLATALLWREKEGKDLVMATHDTALGLAARASGLRVIGI